LTDRVDDVSSTENLQSPDGARAWADAADRKRPLRIQIRRAIADELRMLPPGARVLELGSGPGFLAEQVLSRCTQLATYTLFDFSEPMLDMSRQLVERFPSATFLLGDFRSDGWTQLATGPYEAVVSMQAVHEVRHKRHVPRLYRQVHSVLVPSGIFVVADRTPEDDSSRSTALFMTGREQLQALADAGFENVRLLMSGDALALCRGTRVILPDAALAPDPTRV